jgi:hypothetical protein
VNWVTGDVCRAAGISCSGSHCHLHAFQLSVAVSAKHA